MNGERYLQGLVEQFLRLKPSKFTGTGNLGKVKSWIDGILKSDEKIYLIRDAFPDLNIYTSIGVSCGIPGILLYTGFMIYPLIKLVRHRKQLRGNPLIVLAGISLLGLAISGFSNKEYSNCIGIPVGLLWCYLANFEPNVQRK